jgi:uncharacterized protein
MADDLQRLQTQARQLLLYRNLLQHSAGKAFLALLDGWLKYQDNLLNATVLDAYGQWFYEVSQVATSWRSFVIQQILYSDNPFTRLAQRQSLQSIPASWLAAARSDLKVLQQWTEVGITLIRQTFGLHLPLPIAERSAEQAYPFSLFESESWDEMLPKLVDYYQERGTGIFAQYNALCWQAGNLEGIAEPDPVVFADLVGYEEQQQVLQNNTEGLLQGYRALNILLYGSRGTGKSALVKALVAGYSDRGLRLIEVHKSDMAALPQVIDVLRHSALKFVIFIDDLSFEEEQEDYKSLKVILEGTVLARPQNVVVYATSNRRHLVREYFGDRPRPSNADEVHAWDTVQEKLALSDRFGMTLTFEPPNQERYLQIVNHLALRADLQMSAAELEYQALQWATRRNGRSGRTARQFIDYCVAQSQG